MLEKITPEELEFFETISNPIALSECLFSDVDNLALLNKIFSNIRIGQYPFFSFEYLLDKNPKLSDKENFRLREGSGNCWLFGGRKYGKTLIVEILDTLVSMLLLEGEYVGFTSLDALHIRTILEKIILALENHPFLKAFLKRVNRSPNYRIYLRTGYLLEGVNMNIAGKNPGCFDKDTEILTDKGWKYFKDLSYQDKVLSLNKDNNKVSYENIDKIIKERYCGFLKKLENKTSKFLVTPNHNLLIQKGKILDFISIDSAEIQKQICIPSTFEWINKKDNFIYFYKTENSQSISFKISSEVWCRFIAHFINKGWVKKHSHYKYSIHFKQKNNVKDLEDSLKQLPINYKKWYDKKYKIYRFSFYNKLIGRHLYNYFGQKKDKHLPYYFKNLDSKYLKVFIDEYAKRNACFTKDNSCIFTLIKRLADDLQEVAQKAGYKTHLKIKEQDIYFRGFVYRNYKMYFIQLCSSKNTVFKRNSIENVFYDDYVYCVETKAYNTIFVRRNGSIIWSGNSQFFQKHFTRIIVEEASFETNEIYSKRLDSISENGCVNRVAGMTNFTKYSPCGRIYSNLRMKPWVLNLPQYINPKWDKKEKKHAIREHGGENSINYRIYVKGEVVEEGISVLDMERIRKCYDETRKIKHIEVNKDTFEMYQHIIVVERPKNSEVLYVCGDIGETAPTEIIILAKVNEVYKYLYNITLYNLTNEQQYEIFKYIIHQCEANFISLDTTEGTARAIYRALEKDYRDNLVRCSFNEKIPVDFEQDDYGNIVYKNGQALYVEEYVSEWSIKRIKDLFYSKKMEVPMDYKLDVQFNSLISLMSGNRIVYRCTAKDGDHLLAAFRVFAIAEWNFSFKILKPLKRKTFCKKRV